MLLFHRSDIFKRCGPLTLTGGVGLRHMDTNSFSGNSILTERAIYEHVWYSFSRFSKAIFRFSC
jgi:hypothetical protein